jgi:hypothetical protein
MGEKDPRTRSDDAKSIPNPPDNSNPRPAPGGVGTDTARDPANDSAAQPGKQPNPLPNQPGR